jgi:hypothetical protein
MGEQSLVELAISKGNRYDAIDAVYLKLVDSGFGYEAAIEKAVKIVNQLSF